MSLSRLNGRIEVELVGLGPCTFDLSQQNCFKTASNYGKEANLTSSQIQENEEILCQTLHDYALWLRSFQANRIGHAAPQVVVFPEKLKRSNSNLLTAAITAQRKALAQVRLEIEKSHKETKINHGEISAEDDDMRLIKGPLVTGQNTPDLYYDADTTREPGMPPTNVSSRTLPTDKLGALLLEQGVDLHQVLGLTRWQRIAKVREYEDRRLKLRKSITKSAATLAAQLVPSYRTQTHIEIPTTRHPTKRQTRRSYKLCADCEARIDAGMETCPQCGLACSPFVVEDEVDEFTPEEALEIRRSVTGGNLTACALCGGSSDLNACDYCPRSFHRECVGETPNVTVAWACPVCRNGEVRNHNTTDGTFHTLGTNPTGMIARSRCTGAGYLHSDYIYVDPIDPLQVAHMIPIGQLTLQAGFRPISSVTTWGSQQASFSATVPLGEYAAYRVSGGGIVRPESSAANLAQNPSFSKGNIAAMVAILIHLQRHDFGAPFSHPLNPDELGLKDYRTKIRFPMDLSSVEARLRTGRYCDDQTFSAALQTSPIGPVPSGSLIRNHVPEEEFSPFGPAGFVIDLRRIWMNCKLYNPDYTAIWRMADSLSRECELWCRRLITLTIEQHQEQVAKWRRILKSHYDGIPEPLLPSTQPSAKRFRPV